jgi:hypothetical protein
LARLLLFLAQWDGQKLWLVMDRTHWEFGKTNHNLLVISAGLGDTAMPLIWKALDKDGASNAGEAVALMKRLLMFLPALQIAGLLADREFIDQGWMAWLQKQGVPFVIRIKQNTLATLEKGSTIPVSRICARLREGQCSAIYPVTLSKGARVGVQGKRTSKGIVIVVCSRMPPGAEPVNLYRRRWKIECGFACLKRKGFELEDTHLIHADRLETLMGIVAIAFAWALAIGLLHPKPAIKKHGYPANCRFTLGKQTLIHAMNFTEKIMKLIAYPFVITKSKVTVV